MSDDTDDGEMLFQYVDEDGDEVSLYTDSRDKLHLSVDGRWAYLDLEGASKLLGALASVICGMARRVVPPNPRWELRRYCPGAISAMESTRSGSRWWVRQVDDYEVVWAGEGTDHAQALYSASDVIPAEGREAVRVVMGDEVCDAPGYKTGRHVYVLAEAGYKVLTSRRRAMRVPHTPGTDLVPPVGKGEES